jgi:hypothetical protein
MRQAKVGRIGLDFPRWSRLEVQKLAEKGTFLKIHSGCGLLWSSETGNPAADAWNEEHTTWPQPLPDRC